MKSINLPNEWSLTNLGSIIELKYGKSLPASTRDNGEFPVYGSNGIVGNHSNPLVKTEGIIVGRKGSYGEVQLSHSPFFPIDTTYYIDELFNQPLKYWFYQLKTLPLTKLNKSTAIPGLNREDAYRQSIALPPLAEQKVIADTLDTLLTQVEIIKTHLELIPEILKHFHQSVLTAAVSGNLTKKWRKEGIPFKTTTEELSNLAKFIDYRGKTPIKTDSGIPLITAKNIRQGFISREPREFIALDNYDSWMTRGIPNYGDVLITTEAPLGYIANIDIKEKFALAQRAICLQFKDKLNPYFASIYMQSSEFQKALNENATGSTVKGIKASSLKKIQIKFPSKDEQTEIVRRAEELFAFASSIERKSNTALEKINKLTQSILTKAFCGDLTAEWRAANPELISGNNSANVLLKKIKIEREAIKKHFKQKRSATKKKTGNSMSKQIIEVIEALKQAGEPLTGQQLLTAAGYPNDSNTEQLERFFLDIREALTIEKSIIKIKRDGEGQDWFALDKTNANK
ncbi:hypothetical protein MASR2M36_00240 [Providencia sp.]